MKVIRCISQWGACCQEYGVEIDALFASGTRKECLAAVKDDIRFMAKSEPDSGSKLIFMNGNTFDEDGFDEDGMDLEERLKELPDTNCNRTVIRLQSNDIYDSVYEITYFVQGEWISKNITPPTGKDILIRLINKTYRVDRFMEYGAFKDTDMSEIDAWTDIPEEEWISVNFYEVTDPDREDWNYTPKFILDNPMPENGQRILLKVGDGKGGDQTEIDIHIDEDILAWEGRDIYTENHDWYEDILAWMPIPE